VPLSRFRTVKRFFANFGGGKARQRWREALTPAAGRPLLPLGIAQDLPGGGQN